MDVLWPLSTPGGLLLAAFFMVMLGSAFQVASGVGLGLIAGPGLLFVLSGPAAVQVAILLNLVLTLLLLPSEAKRADVGAAWRLTLWAILGLPVGVGLMMLLDLPALQLMSGVIVLLAAVQLRLNETRFGLALARGLGLPAGGCLSGLMTGAIAVPGPVALWALLNTKLLAQVVRATLRVYFLAAYSIALILHLGVNGLAEGVTTMSLILLPAVWLGIGLGVLAGRRVDGFMLRRLLEVMLLLMGGSLLVKGALSAL